MSSESLIFQQTTQRLARAEILDDITRTPIATTRPRIVTPVKHVDIDDSPAVTPVRLASVSGYEADKSREFDGSPCAASPSTLAPSTPQRTGTPSGYAADYSVTSVSPSTPRAPAETPSRDPQSDDHPSLSTTTTTSRRHLSATLAPLVLAALLAAALMTTAMMTPKVPPTTTTAPWTIKALPRFRPRAAALARSPPRRGGTARVADEDESSKRLVAQQAPVKIVLPLILATRRELRVFKTLLQRLLAPILSPLRGLLVTLKFPRPPPSTRSSRE